MADYLTITSPDDWHVHLRDGALLDHTAAATADYFSRALVMPNLKPALTSVAAVLAYRRRILNTLLEKQQQFVPFMTLYLNEQITAEELEKAKNESYILGAKFYPAGATTNSAEGASSIDKLYPLLDLMQEFNLVLQIHGEVTQGDIFHREAAFINDYLSPLVRNFPKLRIVLEHISTQAAVEFVHQAPETVAATITPHHLLYNRNHLLAGGMKPHYYCLPILKKESDQKAIVNAAISGSPKFFAGTDSAPHNKANKESACACAGIYSAPYAIPMYAEVFDQANKINALNAFMSQFGADFYQLPINQTQVRLRKKAQQIPNTLHLGSEVVVPAAAGETLQWSIE